MSREERDKQMVHSFAHRSHEAQHHRPRHPPAHGHWAGPLELIAEDLLDPVAAKAGRPCEPIWTGRECTPT